MLDGEINSIVIDKGFGFIKSKAGGPDVFFHISALNVELERVSVGQQVHFELDSSADKPRASKVVALGDLLPPGTGRQDSRGQHSRGHDSRGGNDRRSGSRDGRGYERGGRDNRGGHQRSQGQEGRRRDDRGGDRRSRDGRGGDRPRRPVDDRPIEYGFVTKLHRKTQTGFISSVKHGPEFLFEARSVRGEKRYSELEPGDYVEFVVGREDPEYPKQPIAVKIKLAPRNVHIPDAVPSLSRHPKARRRKPSWR